MLLLSHILYSLKYWYFRSFLLSILVLLFAFRFATTHPSAIHYFFYDKNVLFFSRGWALSFFRRFEPGEMFLFFTIFLNKLVQRKLYFKTICACSIHLRMRTVVVPCWIWMNRRLIHCTKSGLWTSAAVHILVVYNKKKKNFSFCPDLSLGYGIFRIVLNFGLSYPRRSYKKCFLYL